MQASAVQVPASVSLAVGGSASGSRSRARSYSRRRSYGRSYSRSRYRSGSRAQYYAKRAIARRAYIRGKYPSDKFAHAYVPRGSAASQALGITPGLTFREASAEEQVRRRAVGWYGKGDYMQAPAIAPMTTVAPSFTGRDLDGSLMSKSGVPTMIRKEVFFNVTTPTTQGQQSIQEFVVNAGLDEMFPFGSQIANNYRKYRITQLAFQYKNMLPQSTTQSQVGQVTLAWNPDVDEQNDLTTSIQVLNDQGSVTCNANEDVVLFCEMDPQRGANGGFLNVRNKGLRIGQDANDFDAGKLVLTLAGFPVTTGGSVQPYLVGRLVVAYCMELSHEIINTAMGNSIDMDMYAKPLTVGTTATSFNPQFWLPAMYRSDNNVGTTIYANTNRIGIQWPSTAFGYYDIYLEIETGDYGAGFTPTVIPQAYTGAQGAISLLSNGTVGPVYDLLDVSDTNQYKLAPSISFVSPASGPNGVSVIAPGDPSCYANISYGYTTVGALTVFPTAANTRARIQFNCHVYVPGVSSNVVAPLASAPGPSPINLELVFTDIISQFTAATNANAIQNAKMTLRITEYNATQRQKLNGTFDQNYWTGATGAPVVITSSIWGP